MTPFVEGIEVAETDPDLRFFTIDLKNSKFFNAEDFDRYAKEIGDPEGPESYHLTQFVLGDKMYFVKRNNPISDLERLSQLTQEKVQCAGNVKLTVVEGETMRELSLELAALEKSKKIEASQSVRYGEENVRPALEDYFLIYPHKTS